MLTEIGQVELLKLFSTPHSLHISKIPAHEVNSIAFDHPIRMFRLSPTYCNRRVSHLSYGNIDRFARNYNKPRLQLKKIIIIRKKVNH